MNKVVLLKALKAFTEAATSEVIMPTSVQKGDEDPAQRAAEVYLMRLPDSKSAKKKAPYILHQFITSKDAQPAGAKYEESSTMVRSIFCVYDNDEQEGGIMLVNLMEALRIPLLEQRIIGKQFELDMEAGVECLAYTDNIAPYFAGEMITHWKLPSIERKVIL